MGFTEGMTPADMAAVTGRNNNGAFGDNGAWWIIILFLFCFMGGWNNNGFGNGSAGATDNYVLASDFATLQRQIDSGVSSLEHKGDTINSGLCDGFYAMNAGMLTGFSNVNTAVSQNGYETRNTITQAQIAQMQSANALQAQLAQCCCDNRAAIAETNYNMAQNANALQNTVNTGFCQTNYNAQSNTRDIIDAMNSGFQSINQRLTAQELAAKDEKIADQNQRLFMANLAASQAAQNETIKGYMTGQFAYYNPRPIPAFVVPNPVTGSTTTTTTT